MEWSGIKETVWIILTVILSLLLILIISQIVIKIINFKSLRFRQEKFQQGELIKNKFFITSDKYELSWAGQINPNGQIIVIGVHDLMMDKTDFNNFNNYIYQHEYQNEISFVYYDQRNSGRNSIQKKRNSGANIADLLEIVNYLKNKYPNQNIILLGEGFSYYMCTLVSLKTTNVFKVIGVGVPIYNPYRLNPQQKNKLFWGSLFNQYSLINLPNQGIDLSTNKQFINHVDNLIIDKGQISIREYHQNKVIQKRAINKMSNLYTNQLIIFSTKDIFYDYNKFSKIENKTINKNTDIIKYDEFKHYILNEPNNDNVFESLLSWITKKQ